MRILTLILILAVSAQPLQAGFCAMGMDQGQAAAMDMPMGMDHGGGHDCCDTEAPESEETCEGGSHCGHCTVASPALPSVLRVPVAWLPAGEFEFSAGVLLPSHSSPPFRPPIS
jgi:hypothetical protein